MPVYTVEQFREALYAANGALILTVHARVIPEMRKTDNPYFDRVSKRVVANGNIGADYEKSVNRALVKMGSAPDFVAGEHPWADYVNRCFVKHKDRETYYIRFIETRRREWWYLDGIQVDRSVFEPWLPCVKPTPVKYRNFMCDNIQGIKWRRAMNLIDHNAN